MAAGVIDTSETAAAYLKRPYARLVVPETDGTFRGEILEFTGCIATGDTPAEALAELEEVAAAWLSAALAHKQNIPEPLENTDFSGRLVLRMARTLHKKAARLAEQDGVSLNQFIVTALAEHVGERANSRVHINFNAGITLGAAGVLAYDNSKNFRNVFTGITPDNVQHRQLSSEGVPWLQVERSLLRQTG